MAIMLFWGLHARPSLAQTATMETCLASGPIRPCFEEASTTTLFEQCGPTRFFRRFVGRLTWPALTNAGPITISVETRAIRSTRYPIYVEILPGNICAPTAPGIVLMATYGGDECGGSWQTRGPINIDQIVPRGSPYVLQIVCFASALGDFSSPGIDCLRVTSANSASEPLATLWGTAKMLYRK
jgi:hypothetical protein